MSKLLHIIFVLILFLMLSGCAPELKLDSYCYRCCACVGIGLIKFDKAGGKFEMEYEYPLKRKAQGKIYYGIGSYTISKKSLYLEFEDLPKLKSEIILTKVRDSDSLILKVKSVKDIQDDSDIFGASLSFTDRKTGKVLGNPYLDHERFIENQSKGKETQFVFIPKNPVVFKVDFISYRTASVELERRGVFTAEVKLVQGYSDVDFKSGEKKVFRITRSDGEIFIRDTQNRKIYFTTQSCYCN